MHALIGRYVCFDPVLAAKCKGVIPSLVLVLLLSALASISKRKTSTWPRAWCKAVWPWASLKFGSRGCWSNFSRTPKSLFLDAASILRSSFKSGGQNSDKTSWILICSAKTKSSWISWDQSSDKNFCRNLETPIWGSVGSVRVRSCFIHRSGLRQEVCGSTAASNHVSTVGLVVRRLQVATGPHE